MIAQQVSRIWEIIMLYGPSILFIFLLTWLLMGLVYVKTLSDKLRHAHQRDALQQSQLQEAHEKQSALMQQTQELQTEMKRLEQTATIMIDGITGLPNCHALMSRVESELSRCKRTQNSCAILFMHLDSFKRINETWGQEAGDAILREASSRLLQNMRAEDFLSCYGREDFALLLVETDLAGAIQTAERLRLEIASHRYALAVEEAAPTTALVITASIGIAIYGLHGNTHEDLIQRAMAAMQRARKEGRNCVRVADIEDVALTKGMEEGYSAESSTINALAAAASAHHEEMGQHAKRIVTLAAETAREMRCTEQEIRLVRLGALLHDIGKIGIPDAILDKPGPLSKEEWEIMRLHPQIGQRILHQAGGIFAALAHIIVAHHERWDGNGYPIGLSRQDIPIEARILTVVDAFDAMTSQRAYRLPSTIDEARRELLHCAGSQFDPEVVIAFLSVLNRYEQLMETEEVLQETSTQSSSVV